MSIINDALKKAQAQLEKNKHNPKENTKSQSETPAPPLTPKQPLQKASLKTSPTPEPKKTMYKKPEISKTKEKQKDSPANWKIPVSIIILLALLGGLYFAMKDRIPTLSASVSDTNPNGKIKPLVKRTYKPGQLVLSGTSSVEGQEFAIINDDLYQVGDMIDGKKIIKIEIKKVELLDPDGNSTYLTSK